MRSIFDLQPRQKIYLFIFLLLLTAVWIVFCQQEIINLADQSSQKRFSTLEREAKPEFKGMELYSWQDDSGDWVFAINIGTNRMKTIDEIKIQPLGFDELKLAISKMAVGESVFWFNNVIHSTAEQKNDLAMPPKEITERLKQHAWDVQVTIITLED